MVRQDLDAGSAYADVSVHGDGLTSLQFRTSPGGKTEEARSSVRAPNRIRLERRGNSFRMHAGEIGHVSTGTGPVLLDLRDPVYVGIGVTSHNADLLETGVFSNVRVEPVKRGDLRYTSQIAIMDLATRKVEIVYTAPGVIEAPNWSRDGKFLLVNTEGDLYRLPLNTGGRRRLEKVRLGQGGYRCNNDHDLSFDNKRLAFSAASPSSPKSQVFVADADGGNVRLVTPAAPSYFHGWSPDGEWLAFVAERGDGRYELYRVPAGGGAEERLTFSGGYDDGPEYSPDGQWIYFNSNRGGRWNLWRMPPDGAGGPGDPKAQRLTSDAPEDWFPHLSPDGKWIVFLSFPHGTEGHNDKMEGMELRLMPAPGRELGSSKVEVLSRFHGGQGTINVNSWSPDSSKFAYVIYEPRP
jgi:Tol biopolymer transport system component